ncbi:MAG: TolC family protein [Bacteroidales bacterium]|nr:TolC family protein [Bacteroidales bacterium]
MIKKFTMLCFAMAIAASAAAQDISDSISSYNFTLEDCLQYAMGNSYTRKSRQLNIESSEAAYQQSKNNRLPSVNASASENMSHTGSMDKVNISGNYSINASQTIYNGGQIKNSIEQSRLQAEQSKIQTSQYDDQLTIQILNEFLNALSCIERLRYQSGIMSSSREELARGEKRFQLGAMIESDYLMLKAQHQRNITDSLNTAISLETSLLNLKQYMSMDPYAELSIIAPDTSAIDAMAVMMSQDDAVAQAKQHMPDMMLARNTMEIANTALEISKAGRRPSISASAGISTGHTDFEKFGNQLNDRFTQQIGVSLSYPIWDRGQAKLNITRARIQQQQAELDLRQTENEITRTVINQWRNTNLEYQRYKAYQQRKDAYAASFAAYKKRFEVGSIVAVDLLQQQNNYISVLNEYINVKYGFILYRKILDIYTGESIGL